MLVPSACFDVSSSLEAKEEGVSSATVRASALSLAAD